MTVLEDARELALRLFRGPQCIRSESTCIRHQSEKVPRLAFVEYDPNKMCHPCAAYWHASMATFHLEQWDTQQQLLNVPNRKETTP